MDKNNTFFQFSGILVNWTRYSKKSTSLSLAQNNHKTNIRTLEKINSKGDFSRLRNRISRETPLKLEMGRRQYFLLMIKFLF